MIKKPETAERCPPHNDLLQYISYSEKDKAP
jgi:hypothetical protein